MAPMDVMLLFVLSLLLITIVVEVARRLLLQDLGVFYATVEKKQYVSETTIYTCHGMIYQDEEFRTYCRLMPRPGYNDNALYRKAHIMHNKDFFMNHAEGDYARVDVKIISIASVIVYVQLGPT